MRRQRATQWQKGRERETGSEDEEGRGEQGLYREPKGKEDSAVAPQERQGVSEKRERREARGTLKEKREGGTKKGEERNEK